MKNIEKSKLYKPFLVLVAGFILTILLFVWYKQYSFRTLKIYSLPYTIESYEGSTISADEQDLQYKETRYFIGQWLQSEYYVAEVVNNSQSEVYISYRTRNSEKFNKLLSVGDSVSLAYSTSDIIDIYSNSEDVSNVSIEVNNYEYMNVLKQIVKWLLFFSVIFTVILAFLLMLLDKYDLIKQILSISIGVFVIIAFISLFLKLYPHIYTTCEYLTVFLGIMLIIMGWSEQIVDKVHPIKKLICISSISMGLIYLIYSQMLNSTKGWLTYFSALNQKAVFDYIALNVILLAIITIGMICLKNGFISVIVQFVSSKQFLYSLVAIELVLMMPLTSWRADMSMINGISLIIIEMLLIALLKRNRDENKFEIKKVLFECCKLLIEVTILISTVINTVYINYWYSHWDIYHSNWYFNSIYDIANNLPFTGGYMETYGHFSVFYKFPLLILGNSVKSLFFITALFMVISLICLYLCAHKLVKKYVYRLLFEISIFICFTHHNAYPMNLPHRILFPSILILFMIANVNKLDRKKTILGYLICLLSVLWSTEVGIFCCVVYIAYVALLKYKQDNSIKTMLVSAICNILLIPTSLVLGYCIIRIYNYTVVGSDCKSYTIKSFLGVLLDKDNMSRGQYNTFYFENAQWIYYWIFLLMIFILGLYKIGLFEGNRRKNTDNRGVLYCVISSIGLAFMVIVLSRPEDYRLVISWILLLSFMILDRVNLKEIIKKESFIRNIYILIIIPIVILVANCMILLPNAIRQIKVNIIDCKRFNYEMIKQDEQKLEKYPVEDIYAVGNGMKLLYFDMGYKLENGNGGLAPEGPGQVDELMSKTEKKYILTDLDVNDLYYTKIDEIKISNKVYSMYIKR